MPERADFEIRFPVVEGYAFALQKDEIKADIKAIEPLILEPEQTPTAVFVKSTAGYEIGLSTTLRPGPAILQDREEYYKLTHLQAIKFEISRRIITALVDDRENAARSK